MTVVCLHVTLGSQNTLSCVVADNQILAFKHSPPGLCIWLGLSHYSCWQEDYLPEPPVWSGDFCFGIGKTLEAECVKQPKWGDFCFKCRGLESCNQTALALQFDWSLEIPSQILDDETLVCCQKKGSCVSVWCVLLEKLLSVSMKCHRGEQAQSCGEGLCSVAFHKPPHPYVKGLEMIWIFPKTQCLIFSFPSFIPNELAAPLRLVTMCWHQPLFFCGLSNVLGTWVRVRLLQWAAQCVLEIFFTPLLAGPQASAAYSIDSFTCISNFSLHESSIYHRQPFHWAINSPWLPDWLGSCAASLWRLIGILKMQETAHVVT